MDAEMKAALAEIGKKLDTVLAAVKGGANAPSAAGSKPAAGAPKVASDADLDGPNGDPVVKFPPKSWKGQDYRGKRFSECSTEFLLVLAEFLEWKGANPLQGKEQYARFDLLDAARARGWAARPMPDGPAAVAGAIGGDDDSIPF